jgi:thioredoxin-like negative regulator of GroEL/TolB-like protein
MKLSTFFKQCSEKEVFKMLSIYVVSSWVILQVLSVTWQPLGIPQKSVTFLILVLLICFPIYIFLLWKLRLKHLEKTEETFDEYGEIQKTGFKKMYFTGLGTISILCFIAVFLIVNKNFSQTTKLPVLSVNDKIAVLKFGNNTGDSKYDIVSKMASDWIIHGITENQVAQVITQDIIDEYQTILKGKNIEENEITIVKEYLKPGKIISGNFYLKNGNLLFQAMLIDGKTSKTIISFKPTECASENPLQCIDDLNESITGYFITKDDKNLMLQQDPPKYEAYKYVLEAKYSNDNDEYLQLLQKAIAADSNYFEPKVLLVGHYYNLGQYQKADSLRKSIKPDSYTNKRQLNLLNMYEALIKGDNRATYKTILNEYDFAPNDLTTNRTAMVVALQYVNRPEDVDAIYKVVNIDSLDLQNCFDCIERLYIKTLADIELGNYTNAIKLIENTHEKREAKRLNKPLAIAYVRAGKIELLAQFLKKIELMGTTEEIQNLYLQVGKEFLLKRDSTKAQEYFNKIINATSENKDKVLLANALFYSNDFVKAETLLRDIIRENPKNIDALSKLAICNFKLGNLTAANKNLIALDGLRADFQYGSIDYALAQYDAATGNEKELYEHLLKAAASGSLYISNTFKNDPQFLNYMTTKGFEEALSFCK